MPTASSDPCYSPATLDIRAITPVAPRWLGGLVRDRFANGRLSAAVGAHGGLLEVNWWGEQHGGAGRFFAGDAQSAWVKLLRVCLRLGEQRFHLPLERTELLPFGYRSRCTVAGVAVAHELLLLPDALVLRARVTGNRQRLPVRFEMVHMESCTAVGGGHRTWGEFAFAAADNALVASCRDLNPPRTPDHQALAQAGLRLRQPESPDATTWIGIGSDAPLEVRRGFHARSKHYLASRPLEGADAAYVVAFATSRAGLSARLAALRSGVHGECAALLAGYRRRLRARPRVSVGDPVLDSAFGQYPELIEALRIGDRPGAVRADAGHYFVWGWDCMTALVPWCLANDAGAAAQQLRFIREAIDPELGIPHRFTSTFQPALKAPFPAQCQFIASLYHYLSTTGDLAARARRRRGSRRGPPAGSTARLHRRPPGRCHVPPPGRHWRCRCRRPARHRRQRACSYRPRSAAGPRRRPRPCCGPGAPTRSHCGGGG